MVKKNIDNFDIFVFDFDGVLTNNMVYLSEDNVESVQCSRSDGLAFDVLNRIDKRSIILSTEKNQVVSRRAEKLKITAIQGVSSKVDEINKISKEFDCELDKIVYVGNDLNDFLAMSICGLKICPADSHIRIKDLSDICLKTIGGHGIVREILEDIFDLDVLKLLYSN